MMVSGWGRPLKRLILGWRRGDFSVGGKEEEVEEVAVVVVEEVDDGICSFGCCCWEQLQQAVMASSSFVITVLQQHVPLGRQPAVLFGLSDSSTSVILERTGLISILGVSFSSSSFLMSGGESVDFAVLVRVSSQVM